VQCTACGTEDGGTDGRRGGGEWHDSACTSWIAPANSFAVLRPFWLLVQVVPTSPVPFPEGLESRNLGEPKMLLDELSQRMC